MRTNTERWVAFKVDRSTRKIMFIVTINGRKEERVLSFGDCVMMLIRGGVKPHIARGMLRESLPWGFRRKANGEIFMGVN